MPAYRVDGAHLVDADRAGGVNGGCEGGCEWWFAHEGGGLTAGVERVMRQPAIPGALAGTPTVRVDAGPPIHAVTNGVVVSVTNDRPEVPPFTTTDRNPTIRDRRDYAGNDVVEKIAPGKYAAYLHMQTGMVRVRPGRRLRTGQVIGLLGNTDNTTGPHLHFGIQDSPAIFTSNSLPFEIRSFTVKGTGVLGGKPAAITLTGTPRRTRSSEPLIRTVDRF